MDQLRQELQRLRQKAAERERVHREELARARKLGFSEAREALSKAHEQVRAADACHP